MDEEIAKAKDDFVKDIKTQDDIAADYDKNIRLAKEKQQNLTTEQIQDGAGASSEVKKLHFIYLIDDSTSLN